MKHIIIYGVVAVLMAVGWSTMSRAEIVGLKDVSECPTKNGTPLIIKDKKDLFTALANLTPQLQPNYFQYDKKPICVLHGY